MKIYVALMTAHMFMPADHGLNEQNYLVAAEYKGATVGTMVNSYDKRSYLGGYTLDAGQWSFGLIGATGYEETPMNTPLLFYPTVAYNVPVAEWADLTAMVAGQVFNAGLTFNF